MRASTVTTFTPTERRALKACHDATRALVLAQRRQDDTIRRAAALGLPVRLVGEWAGVSGAHVSRLVNGKYGGDDE